MITRMTIADKQLGGKWTTWVARGGGTVLVGVAYQGSVCHCPSPSKGLGEVIIVLQHAACVNFWIVLSWGPLVFTHNCSPCPCKTWGWHWVKSTWADFMRKGVCMYERGRGCEIERECACENLKLYFTRVVVSVERLWKNGNIWTLFVWLMRKTMATFDFWLLCLLPGYQQSTSEWQQAEDGPEVPQVCPVQPMHHHVRFLCQLCSWCPSAAVTTHHSLDFLHPNHHPPLYCQYIAYL